MLCGVHQRLTSDSYTSSHHCLPTVLDKWSRVLAACELKHSVSVSSLTFVPSRPGYTDGAAAVRRHLWSVSHSRVEQ